MKVFEFEFTLDEISQIINLIYDRINQDRNALCLLLHFSNEFLKDWYNEINTLWVPLVIKGGFMDLGETDKNKLVIFITERLYSYSSNVQTSLERSDRSLEA
jgi:hypothetical protein